jgi:predicted site-specific integrase-resolvase
MTHEAYVSIPEASERLGVPEYALRAAAKEGRFPLYAPFSKRWAVKISEIEAAIARTQMGRAA